MTREGLDAPTDALPAADVETLRAFLDGQSRLRLLVWVRHVQDASGGPAYDHSRRRFSADGAP